MEERKGEEGRGINCIVCMDPLSWEHNFWNLRFFKYLYIQNELSWGWDTYLNTTPIHVS